MHRLASDRASLPHYSPRTPREVFLPRLLTLTDPCLSRGSVSTRWIYTPRKRRYPFSKFIQTVRDGMILSAGAVNCPFSMGPLCTRLDRSQETNRVAPPQVWRKPCDQDYPGSCQSSDTRT
eukprot:3864299-Amphidinium_carterae.1